MRKFITLTQILPCFFMGGIVGGIISKRVGLIILCVILLIVDIIVGITLQYFFEKGIDKILKKVGEESTEVIIAAKADDKRETVYEIADLAYHVMVLMIEMGISLDDIRAELASRHVVDHKVKQEKMTE